MQTRRTGFALKLSISVTAIVALQALIYFAILDRTVGSSRWLGSAAGRRPFRVAILRSENASRLNPEHPERYFDLSKQWETVLADAKTSYHVIDDKTLARGLGDSADVLVLPWAVCLDDAERKVIQSFVASGKGLVLSGATGARAGNCSWSGWDTLSRLTGLKNPSAGPAPAPLRGTYTGNSFYFGAVPGGYQLPLANQEVVTGDASEPDIYASDSRLRPLMDAPGGTVALHGERGHGRFVWFGFPETMPMRNEAGRGILNAYMFSAVEWAGRRPVAAVANWPHAAKSAVVIAARVASDASVKPTIAALREAQMRATFFMDNRTVSQSPDLVRTLASLGEIASSGDTAATFAEQNSERQSARLEDARRRLQSDVSVPAAGFAPPDDLWDEGTIAALRNTGFAYYLDRANASRAVPELIAAPQVSFLPVRQVPLARLEAPFASDFDAMADSADKDPGERLWNDFQLVERTGGAYTLSFRTDLLGAPENAESLRGLLHAVKSRDAWIATGSEMADWWVRHDRVQTAVHQVNDQRIRLAVSNNGSHPVGNVSVYVYLPYTPSKLRVTALLGNSVPPYQVSSEGVLRLDFAKLGSRASYTCLISMDDK